MRSAVIALFGAAVAVVADVHNHGHQHLHNRAASPDQVKETVTGPVVVVYELNGKFISEADVEEGIRNGTLVYAPNGQVIPSASLAAYSSTWTAPTSTSTSTPPPPPSTTSTSTPPPPPSTSSSAPPPPPSSSSAPAPKQANVNSNSNSGSPSGGQGVDSPFPNGQLDCSHFPSDYGAVAVDWMKLGGWTGVQNPGSSAGGFDNILTVTPAQCNGNVCCTEGSFCSYACPAGYQKIQWPSTQGATGQSVGGIQCKNGKLWLTNDSKTLCGKGASGITVQVVNNMGDDVAVCRTDYPGTEAMTVPLNAKAGSTQPLTCPDEDNFYTHGGLKTSAQYYVNNKGISVDKGCVWGDGSSPLGNFAPLNIGIGYTGGVAWPAIFQNAPTTQAKLDFKVSIEGDVDGACTYQNGQYCGAAGCSSLGGCTVRATGGTVKFVFSN